MDNCIAIEKYKESLLQLTNNCGLTIATACFIVKDLYLELQKLYNQQLQEELKQLNETGSLEKELVVDIGEKEIATENIVIGDKEE